MCLKMIGLLPSFARGLYLAYTFIHTHFMRVRADKALGRPLHTQMRLSFCLLLTIQSVLKIK